ncbi:MAG: DUF2927 domain-containing protein [Pseudomonadota bacterium]
MRKLSVLAVWALAACTPAQQAQVTKNIPTVATSNQIESPVDRFVPQPLSMAPRTSGSLARDFAELSFAMESGRPLPWFSRFEGPITVAMTGDVPPTARADLQRLMARLRNEAGLPVQGAAPDQVPSITIEFSPRSALRRLAPTAACFVVPNVSSLAEYRAARGTARADWAQVKTRTKAAIFVPSDTSPQEIRDCLHEEMAQAMGPLNDLYRLPDSVFNDDNFNTVLTSFDMQILRLYYSQDLASGMSRAEVVARLPAIAARMAPVGAARDVGGTPNAWSDAIEMALGGRAGQGARLAAAERALMTARAQGWQDGRLAFSHFALGRLYVASDPARAVRELAQAARLYRAQPGGAVQVAHVEMQLAAIAVAMGNPGQAIAFADRAIPVIRRAENASLLATVMLIKAEALDMTGRSADATALRLDSQSWSRYGFGSEANSRARLREIAALGARGRRG